ncbi:LysR family transcriptional regulator [Streptomyces spiroverticillatus]|uniref:LysR family transcriptional regulator n=1 Tax=Streptomyces finlayi TaxID=67296 RepID=A0A918WXP3_9ACTN|nr:LysR family transcriptional regulator [Streptomyces finlayi]GGZ91430.1 LysR family transcriptional regulator [Streptomyces spiroverticillatus]GHC93798.1 LysR family transcriptional regulator [Streptomyces finlayi]
MQLPDLNLLPALDALLRTGSVAGAAAEMRVSASAMSRTLGRLRRVVGDPLLVPAGRGLVPTPAAEAMRPGVRAALEAASMALQPPQPLELASLQREFTIRSSDSFCVSIGSDLVAYAAEAAPGVRLRMLPEGDEDPADLRDGVDLDVGVLPALPPDVRSLPLGTGGYAAVAREGAPFARRPLTVEEFAAVPHVTVSRHGRPHSVVDERLHALGLARDVLATVPTYSAACFMALGADVLALVPAAFAPYATREMALVVLEIPLDLPEAEHGMAWHLRLDADPAHRWLRTAVARLAREQGRASSPSPGVGLPSAE